jgi:radical SAM-linked protein
VVGGDDPAGWEPRGWHKIRDRVEGRSSPRAVGFFDDAEAVPPSAAPAHRRPAEGAPQRGLGNAEEWLSASSEGLAPPPPAAGVPPVKRIRITYWKRGRGRFISHLELIDVFTRALRRARLPVAFSGGHHPQPRLRFSPGLPVGAESDCEIIDIDFTELVSGEDVGRRLVDQLPEGLGIVSARDVSLREASPDRHLSAFRFRVDVESLVDDDRGEWIDGRLAAFLDASTFPVLKRRPKGDKRVDARQLVTHLERVDAAHIELDVRFTAEGSIKPSDFLAAILGVDGAVTRSLPMRKTNAFYDGESDGASSP